MENSPRRRAKAGGRIALCIISILLLAIVILCLVYLPVLKLVVNPNDITMAERSESLEVLRELEQSGKIKNLSTDGSGSIYFVSPDGSISISSAYEGERLVSVRGEIIAEHSTVQTIGEAKSLAGVMLSPYLEQHETDAILVRFSPEIIANAGGSRINMSLDIGPQYRVSISGSPYETVTFNIDVLSHE